MNKIFSLWTFGGGTPLYLIAAATKEEAFKMAEEQWKLDGYGCSIGQTISPYTGNYTEGNTVNDVKDTGFTTGRKGIINIFEL